MADTDGMVLIRYRRPDMSNPASVGLAAKVLTVSDGVAHGTRDDASGRALVEQLTGEGFDVVEHRVTADGADLVADALTEMSAGFAGAHRDDRRDRIRAARPDPGGNPRA